jgi:hypothetical protein
MGQIVNPTQPQRASIPSKFETILNTGTREKDGFSRRTHRFDEPENELPGPGFYHRQDNLVKDPKGDYTSKRGTGSFASTEKRFYEAPRPLFVVPGPGKYEGEKAVESTNNAVSAKGSAAFVTPVPRRAIPNKSATMPGPGHYGVPLDAHRDDRESAIFRSSTKRSDLVTHTKQNPGPGQYGDMLLKHKSVTEEAANAISRPAFVNNPLDPENPRPAPPVTGAVFRSATDRDGKKMHKIDSLDPHNLPPVPGMPHPSPPKAQKPPGSPVAVAAALTANADPDDERIARPSSMFAPTTLDRFGRPTVKFSLAEGATPGPGHYEGPYEPKKLLISSSWAMSAVDRFKPEKSKRSYKPPGPAFYSAKSSLTDKNNFHNNARGQWV